MTQPDDTDTPPQRGPVHNDQAEQAVLGAILTWPDTLPAVTERLTSADFYRPAHAMIYATVVANWAAGQPTDPLTLAHQLIGDRSLHQLGGGAYLHTLLTRADTPTAATWHADLVADTSHRRQLETTALRILHLTQNPELDPGDAAQQATRLLHDTTTHVTTPAVNGNRWRGRLRITAASEFQIRPVAWLWDQRIPLGELTLLAGREGAGKSSTLAWMAAQITNGNLPGHHHGDIRAVLYAASEESWEATIAPRMLAAGADLSQVYRLDTTDPDDRGITLPKDTSHLPYLARDIGAAALMCDPIVSLIDDDISPNRPKDLRRALEPLRAACDQAGIACIALAHLNKSSAEDIGTLIAGSRAWAEVPRAILGTVQDRDADEPTWVLSQIKNNLGRLDLPHLAYTLRAVTLETDHTDPVVVARLVWLGESDQSAEDLLNLGRQPATAGNRPLAPNAARILQIIRLHGHPMSSQDITQAVQPDIAPATVRQILSRLTRSGRLEQPVRGTYTTPNSR